MKILIHACPQRMFYVEGFLVPRLLGQGAEDVRIFCDDRGLGNLAACMEAFSGCEGDGGTWHLQDDVLPCRDFVERCRVLDKDLVYGFCCRNFGDRTDAWGRVYIPDAWNSFQCVRIPDPYARACAAWVRSGAWARESPSAELPILWQLGRGDDTFFHEFMSCRHGTESAYNAKPNLVEHVDWLLGGSTLHQWQGYIARSEYWDDPESLAQLRTWVKESLC